MRTLKAKLVKLVAVEVAAALVGVALLALVGGPAAPLAGAVIAGHKVAAFVLAVRVVVKG